MTYKLSFFENFDFFWSHQYLTIHTPIESISLDDKKYAVFKIIYCVIRPKNAKTE